MSYTAIILQVKETWSTFKIFLYLVMSMRFSRSYKNTIVDLLTCIIVESNSEIHVSCGMGNTPPGPLCTGPGSLPHFLGGVPLVLQMTLMTFEYLRVQFPHSLSYFFSLPAASHQILAGPSSELADPSHNAAVC